MVVPFDEVALLVEAHGVSVKQGGQSLIVELKKKVKRQVMAYSNMSLTEMSP